MLILGLMLLIVTGCASIIPQTDIFACPAQCVIVDFSYNQFKGAPVAFMLLNIIFLTWGYSVALIPLFKTPRKIQSSVRRSWPRWARCGGCGLGRKILRALRSDWFKIGFSVAFFGLGLYELVKDRLHGRDIIVGSEDEMSFGQILAMALLTLPIWSALEFFLGLSMR